MTDLHEGGCLCGDIRYRVRGLPLEAIVCHCTSCQRHTGGTFRVAGFFPAENVEYAGPSPTTFEHRSDESDRWLRLEFCPLVERRSALPVKTTWSARSYGRHIR
jgi:hypothetical protein